MNEDQLRGLICGVAESAGKQGFDSPYYLSIDEEGGAIRNTFAPEHIGELAVAAGNDMILMCHTPEFQDRVIRGIVEAVREGRIAESRLDESLQRIARLQEHMLLHRLQSSSVPPVEWERRTAELTRRTLKLLCDPLQQLPLSANRKNKNL